MAIFKHHSERLYYLNALVGPRPAAVGLSDFAYALTPAQVDRFVKATRLIFFYGLALLALLLLHLTFSEAPFLIDPVVALFVTLDVLPIFIAAGVNVRLPVHKVNLRTAPVCRSASLWIHGTAAILFLNFAVVVICASWQGSSLKLLTSGVVIIALAFYSMRFVQIILHSQAKAIHCHHRIK